MQYVVANIFTEVLLPVWKTMFSQLFLPVSCHLCMSLEMAELISNEKFHLKQKGKIWYVLTAMYYDNSGNVTALASKV